MKKAIIIILTAIAFLYIIGDIDQITLGLIICKAIALFWIYLVAKANTKENKEKDRKEYVDTYGYDVHIS